MVSIFQIVAVTLGVCVLYASDSFAQEWTRFRGPNGTGISECKDIPAKWSENDILWKAELPAEGHSSPVIWGDRVFLTGADDGQPPPLAPPPRTGEGEIARKTGEREIRRRAVFAVDTRDGSIAWTKWYPAREHRKHQLNSFASGTPAVDAERVYVEWTTPEAHTVKAFTHEGEEVWSRELGPYVSQHGGGTSPIVFEDLLIVGDMQDAERGGKSRWLALDRRTGEIEWELDRTSEVAIYSTPFEHRTRDGDVELVFNSQPHGMTGINPRTGKVNWELSDLFDKRTISSPVVAAGDLLIGTCGSGGGGNYVVAVHPGTTADPGAAKLAYKITRQAPYVPTPIALGDLLFLWSDGGIVSCVEARTGEVHWTKRVGGTYYGSPVCVDGKLFCTDVNGNVVVVAAEKKFKELGRNDLNELCHSTPAVADGRMYVRTFGSLFCVGK